MNKILFGHGVEVT